MTVEKRKSWSTTMGAVLHKLDERACLGLRIWEFCARSLSQAYGDLFLREVVLRHPLRTVAGLVAYRRFARRSHWDEIYPVGVGSAAAFLRPVPDGPSGSVVPVQRQYPPVPGTGVAQVAQTAWHGAAGWRGPDRDRGVVEGGDLLVAVGFCQKPLPRPGVHGGCPAGRANHLCSFLEWGDLLSEEGTMHPACQECDIHTVAIQALAAGAAMHIMTSAQGIAHDIFLPTLRTGRFPRAIMTICPYSVQPMALPILICGMEALLFTYGSGDCRDYAQWLRADRGVKPERTCLSPTVNARLLAVLDEVGRARAASGHPRPAGFRRDGNVYLPRLSA